MRGSVRFNTAQHCLLFAPNPFLTNTYTHYTLFSFTHPPSNPPKTLKHTHRAALLPELYQQSLGLSSFPGAAEGVVASAVLSHQHQAQLLARSSSVIRSHMDALSDR